MKIKKERENKREKKRFLTPNLRPISHTHYLVMVGHQENSNTMAENGVWSSRDALRTT
jgi:hypothetical protein